MPRPKGLEAEVGKVQAVFYALADPYLLAFLALAALLTWLVGVEPWRNVY